MLPAAQVSCAWLLPCRIALEIRIGESVACYEEDAPE
jgi:hypothetical protein